MSTRSLRWRFALLLLPLALVVAGLAAVAYGVVGLVQAERTHRDLTRFEAGEPTEIEVSEPGRHLVWVRHDDYGGADPAPMTLTVRRGEAPVASRALPGDVTYQETDTAITAHWAFDADQPGSYTVTGTDINQSTTFLTGTDDPQARKLEADRWMKRGILALTVGLVGALAIGVLLGRRTRRRTAPTPPQP